MSRANRKPPNRTATRKPAVPKAPVGWWRGMPPERLQAASWALGGDDATEEELDALEEYLGLGGNPAGL